MTRKVVTRAAIDLGSNSFHLLIRETDAIRTVTVERMKQKVQLALGVESAMMAQEAIDRGLECLARFAQRLAAIDCRNVNIAGTCALRNSRNSSLFIEQAERILGCNVRIVTGEEEAHLIYLGAIHRILPVTGSKLVIDIGGGSTEFAFGDSAEAKFAHSVDIGCVEMMDRFFRQDLGGARVEKAEESSSAFLAARDHALSMLGGLDASVLNTRDVEILGTSGTIDSIQKVLAANGWGSGEVSVSGLKKLETGLANNRWPTGGSVPGLEPERVDIFPAGVAILCAVFKLLNIERMRYLDASLLDGLMISARMKEERDTFLGDDNLCEKSVMGLMRRYAVDEQQVARVSSTLGCLWKGVADNWNLGQTESGRLLIWSAKLHEIGIQIAVRHYHRHGSYIIKHSEITGLSNRMRTELALLVRNHRRGFKEVAFSAFAPGDENRLMKLSVLLRIAVILERSRNDADSPAITVSSTQSSIRIVFESDWLVDHALSRGELAAEESQLDRLGIKLECL